MTQARALFRLHDGWVDLDGGTVHRGARITRLRPKERELLAFVADSGSRGATRDELLVEVWGYTPTARTNTVRTTVARLRRALGGASTAQPPLPQIDGRYRWAAPPADGFAGEVELVMVGVDEFICPDHDEVLSGLLDDVGDRVYCFIHRPGLRALASDRSLAPLLAHLAAADVNGACRVAHVRGQAAPPMFEGAARERLERDFARSRAGELTPGAAPVPKPQPSGPQVRRVSGQRHRVYYTTWIGRPELEEQISRSLVPGAVVTLHGPGGAGKTRLALRALEADVDGVVLDLALLSRGSELRSALNRALGVGSDEAARRTLAWSPRLVVLDNAEHLVRDVSQLVDDLRAGAGACRFLVTSRRPLDLTDEVVVRVGSLDTAAARALFEERAGTSEDGDAVEALTAHLDNLPLAIELAACRVGLLGARALLDRLRDHRRVDLLEAGDRPSRHASLPTTVGWSIELLTPAERTALTQCAVFPGAFSVEAAEAVLDLSGHDADVLDALEGLMAHALLCRASGRRVALYRTVRDVVLQDGPAPAALARHADWCTRRAAELLARCDGPDDAAALDEIGAVESDMWQAFHTLVGSEPERAASLLRPWLRNAMRTRVVDRLREVAEALRAHTRDSGGLAYAMALDVLVHLDSLESHASVEVQTLATEAAGLYDALGREADAANMRGLHGRHFLREGGRAMLDPACATLERLGDARAAARLVNLACAFAMEQDEAAALDALERARVARRRVGSSFGQLMGHVGSAHVQMLLNDVTRAMRSAEKAAALARELGAAIQYGHASAVLYQLHDRVGNHTRADQHLAACAAVHRQLGSPRLALDLMLLAKRRLRLHEPGATALLGQAVDIASDDSNESTLAFARIFRGMSLDVDGRLIEAVGELEAGMEGIPAVSVNDDIGPTVCCYLAGVLVELGEIERARRLLSDNPPQDPDDEEWVAYHMLGRARLAVVDGDLDTARALREQLAPLPSVGARIRGLDRMIEATPGR